jgi:hypothetical protein
VTEQARPVVEAVTRLRAALELAAGAMTRADLDALLASEAQLELALKYIRLPQNLAGADRQAIRAELDNAERALRRCRSLGGMLLDTVRLTFEAHGRTTGYGRREGLPAMAAPPRLNTIG